MLLALISSRVCDTLTTSGTCQLDTANDSLWSVYQLKTLEGELVYLDRLAQLEVVHVDYEILRDLVVSGAYA